MAPLKHIRLSTYLHSLLNQKLLLFHLNVFLPFFHAVCGFSKSLPASLPLDGIYIQTWSWLQNYLCGYYT